jgi:methionine aminopeptidase
MSQSLKETDLVPILERIRDFGMLVNKIYDEQVKKNNLGRETGDLRESVKDFIVDMNKMIRDYSD